MRNRTNAKHAPHVPGSQASSTAVTLLMKQRDVSTSSEYTRPLYDAFPRNSNEDGCTAT